MKDKPKYYKLSKDIIKTKGDVVYNYQNYDLENREIYKKIWKSLKNKNYSDVFEFFEDFDLDRKIEIMIYFPEIYLIAPINWAILFQKWEKNETDIVINEIIDNAHTLTEYILKDFTEELHKKILNNKSKKLLIGGSYNGYVPIKILNYLDSQNIIMDIDFKNVFFYEYAHYFDIELFISVMKQRKFSDYEISSWLFKNIHPTGTGFLKQVYNGPNKLTDFNEKIDKSFLRKNNAIFFTVSSGIFEYITISLLNNKNNSNKDSKNIIKGLIDFRLEVLPENLLDKSRFKIKGILNRFIEDHILIFFAEPPKNKHIVFEYLNKYEMFYLNHVIKNFNAQISKLSKASVEYNFSFDKLEMYDEKKHNYENLIPSAIKSLKKSLSLVLLQKKIIKNHDEFQMHKIYNFFKGINKKFYIIEFIEQYYKIINKNEDSIYETLDLIRLLMKGIIKDNITLVKSGNTRKKVSPKTLILRKLSAGEAYDLNYDYIKKIGTGKTPGYAEFVRDHCAGLEKIINDKYKYVLNYKMDKNRDYSEELMYEFFKDVDHSTKIKISNNELYLMKYMIIDWEEGLKKIKKVSNFSNLDLLDKLSKKDKEIINQKIYKLGIPRSGKYILGSPYERIWLFLLQNNFKVNMNVDKLEYKNNSWNKTSPDLYLSYCLEVGKDIFSSASNIMVLTNNNPDLSPAILGIQIWNFILEKPKYMIDGKALSALSRTLSFFFLYGHANTFITYENHLYKNGVLYKFVKILAETNKIDVTLINSSIKKVILEMDFVNFKQKEDQSLEDFYDSILEYWLDRQTDIFASHMPKGINNFKSDGDVMGAFRQYYFLEDNKSFEILLIICISIWMKEHFPQKSLTLAILRFIKKYYKYPVKREKRPYSFN